MTTEKANETEEKVKTYADIPKDLYDYLLSITK